jgi:hypothetical protein
MKDLITYLPIRQELRDELYILGLKYPYQVKETYDTIKSEKIKARLFNVIKPELTIAKLISEDVFKEIESWWLEEIGQRDTVNYEDDWTFLAYKQIYELNTEDFFNLSNDVVEPVGRRLYDDSDYKKFKRSMATVIGNAIGRSPIFKRRLVNGKTNYKVNRNEFISLLKAKKYYEIILGSTTSTTSTTSTSSTTSTKEVQDKLILVDVVELVEPKPLGSTIADMSFFIGSYGSEGCPVPDFLAKYNQEALDKLLEQGLC